MWRALWSFQSRKQTQARLPGPVRPLHPACQNQSQRTRGQSFGFANRRAACDGTAREQGAKGSPLGLVVRMLRVGEVKLGGRGITELSFSPAARLFNHLPCSAGGGGGFIPSCLAGCAALHIQSCASKRHKAPFPQERWCPKRSSRLTPLFRAVAVWGGRRVGSQAPSAPCS